MWHCTFGQEILRVWRIVVSSSVSVSPRNWHSSKNAWLWRWRHLPTSELLTRQSVSHHSTLESSPTLMWGCLTVLLGYVDVFKSFRIFDFLILLPAVEITKLQLGENAKHGTGAGSYSKCGICSWLYDQFGFVNLWYSSLIIQQLITWYSFVMKLYQ